MSAPKSNLGKPLPNAAVRGLLRAMMGVQARPGRIPPRFDRGDDTGLMRFYTPEQIGDLADRLLKLAGSGKVARLRPETAHLCYRALRAFAVRPTHHDLLAIVCRDKSCAGRRAPDRDSKGVVNCYQCDAVVNTIMLLLDGDRGRDAVG